MNDPVQHQLEAYNAHDVDSFLTAYADDVVITDATGTESMRGVEAMRAAYSELFKNSPDLRAEVPHRVSAGSWTVDEEHVTRGDEAMTVLVAYHVNDGRIDRVVMLQG
jgi:hypothetical protein